MREIKFRAWVKFPNKTNMDPTMQYNAQDWASFGKLCKDDSEVILMQYTGLKDKNGKEIWEGDVLEFDNEDGIWRCPVVFERGLFGLDVHNVKQVKNPDTWNREYDRVRSRWWSTTWGYEEMGTAFTFRKPLAQDTIFKGDYKEYRDSEERKKQEEIGWGKYFMHSAKVIGNIYENSELLEDS